MCFCPLICGSRTQRSKKATSKRRCASLRPSLRDCTHSTTHDVMGRVKWQSVAALPMFEKAGNRKHLESWKMVSSAQLLLSRPVHLLTTLFAVACEQVSYLFNPSAERVRLLIVTKVKEDKTAVSEAKTCHLIAWHAMSLANAWF
jgi:hypothetical protein